MAADKYYRISACDNQLKTTNKAAQRLRSRMIAAGGRLNEEGEALAGLIDCPA